MASYIALILWFVAAIVLLRIESKANPQASLFLWVPTLWTLIAASRPVTRWLSPTARYAGSAADGSFADRVVLSGLIAVGIVVLATRRRIEWSRVWKENWPIFLLFAFIGMSILWSDVPYVSFKRWLRSSGAVVMGLVVLSDVRPLRALESVLRRCAYLLVPLSLVLIKYVPEYGRAYGRSSGAEMWTGVGTHKNALGVLCAVSVIHVSLGSCAVQRIVRRRCGTFSKGG